MGRLAEPWRVDVVSGGQGTATLGRLCLPCVRAVRLNVVFLVFLLLNRKHDISSKVPVFLF